MFRFEYIFMKDDIVRMLQNGCTQSEIVKELGCAKSTVSYHAKKLGKQIFVHNKYDWSEIARYQDQGHSMTECMEEFGFQSSGWMNAIKRGEVKPSTCGTRNISDVDMLKKSSRRKNSKGLKRRLIKSGVLEYRCYGENCTIADEWLGQFITLQLDHIDGDGTNNESENLRLLCPNCHAQTETFGGKNRNFYKQKLAKLKEL